MTTNPLARLEPIDGLFRIEGHVAKLNNYRWIADSGKPYFVNQRTRADGTTEHFADRHI